MKSFFLILLCCVLTLSSFASDKKGHEHKEHKDKHAPKIKVKGTQKKCPVGGKAIKDNSFAIIQGQKIFFCCNGCDKKFKKHPDKYFKVMKERNELAASIQTKCAVSGDKLEDYDTKVSLPGRNIYFCCKDCIKDFNKDKEKYLKAMDHHKESEKDKKKKHEHGDHKH